MNSTLPVQTAMTEDFETPSVRGFVPSALPWILGAVMLAVFLVTLSRWVNPFNLSEVVDLSNWNQGSQMFGPVTLLVTLPLRWLPPNLIPLALNLFSACCGAIALGLLARSVALLPHDRTHEQREREESEFSILSIPMAWLPPLFAVLVCGLQLTFWQHATIGSVETFDLLLFAYVIHCLLEYRISGDESWLTKFAIVYGLGMANNWAMVGFFPAFLAAVIWIKGLGAFNPRFIIKTFCLGIAGVSLFFLLPLMNKYLHSTPVSYWQTMKTTLSGEKNVLAHFPRDVVGVLALTSILPVFVMGIKWTSYFGDNSPLGIFLASSMFRIVHALFLLACLWVALDSPISPRSMMIKNGLPPFPFLTFYYLGGLVVGYLSGYFLLIFGVNRPRQRVHTIVRALKYCGVAGVCLLLLIVPGLLVRKNLPHILAFKSASQLYESYFTQIAERLPSPVTQGVEPVPGTQEARPVPATQAAKSVPFQGAVILGDDSFRVHYLQAVLNRDGHSPDLLIDTSKLEADPGYLSFLQKANPGYEICGKWTNIPPTAAPAMAKVQLIEHLALEHPIYYLHPSFGYFFEKYYAEPHGMVYQLKPYPSDSWDVPQFSERLIAENQGYWKRMFAEVLPPVIDYMTNLTQPAATGVWKKILDTLHLKPEQDNFAAEVGIYYARVLDEWGMQLQVSGHRPEALKCFNQVLELNPSSVPGRVNQSFDEQLAQGKRAIIQPAKNVARSLEQYNGNWTELLRVDGPIDEPSFRSELGLLLYNGGNYRQAIQQFNRVRTLVPDDPRVPLQIAQILINLETYTNGLALLLPYTECYSMALTNIDLVLKTYPNEPFALFLKSFALMQMKSYDRAIEPLTQLLNEPARTNNVNSVVVQLNRAISYYKVGNYDAAKADYQAVGRVMPKAYQVYYGLAEIAYHEKDKPAAIKNYELYLTNAPADTEEAKLVTTRLKELKSGAP